MRKIYILSLLFLIAKFSFSQTYLLTSALNGTTNTTCKGDVTNTVCNYGTVISPLYYYCQGIDRWQAFTNGGSGPIRINLTYLSLNTGDFVRIYQGVGTGGTLLASFTNTVTTIGNFVTSNTGVITVRFTTNTDNAVGDGFDAIIGCQPTGCNGNNPAGDSCSTATRICDVSPYCGNTGGWYTDGAEGIDNVDGSGLFCGSIENNSWIVFTANTPSPSFQVNVAACTSTASGIQMQMLSTTNCSTFTSVSACVSQSAAATSFTLSPNVALVPGTSYYLMVDGYAGNYCSYTVTPLVGVQVPTVSIPSPTICSGQTTTITLNESTSGSTYSWTSAAGGAISGSTTNSFVVISPTANVVYSITVNQPNGCATDIYSQSVTVNSPPTLSVSNATNCAGVAVNLSASGATSYSWNTGAVTSNISVSPNTTTIYTVTGTTNNCSNTKTVSVNTTPNPTVAVSNATNCAGATVNLIASGATTYLWNTGATTSSISVSPNVTTVYTVTGTSSGCSNTQTVSVNTTQNPTVAVSNATNCAGNPVTLTASGATTYSWSTGATSSTTTVSPGTTTIYTVTGTTSGCINVKTVTVTSTSIPTVTASNATVCNGNAVILNASGASTFLWSTGANTASVSVTPTTTTVYSYTGTTSGCSNSNTVSVTVNSVPITTVSTTGVLTCTNSSVVLNSSLAASSYTWTAPAGGSVGSANTQSTSASGAAGMYTLVISNAAGCSYTTTASVTQNTSVPSGVSAGSNQTLGCGSGSVVTLSGSVTSPTNAVANWSGPSISGSSTSFTTSVNGAGTYTLTVSNPLNGCSTTSTVMVNPSSGSPIANISSTALIIDCNNASPSVTVTSNPSSGVSYSWNNVPANLSLGGSVASFTDANTYICTVTNTLSNCSTPVQVVVSSNTVVPTSTVTVSGVLTCTSLTVSLNAGLSGMNYTWTAPSGGSVTSINTQSTAVTGAGNYSVTVVDPSNGCSQINTVNVTQNTVTPVGLNAGSNQTLSCSSSSVTLIGSITTPTNAIYLWTGPGVCGTATTIATDVCASGDYTLTATNPINGCSGMASVHVFPNAGAPSPTITASALVLDCNNSVKTVTVTSTPNTDVTYSWNNTPATLSTDGSVATFTNANTYICTVTNTLSNCSTPIQVIVTVDTLAPIINITGTQTLTCSNPTVAISVTTTPASGLTYNWSGIVLSGQGTNSVVVGQANTYSVIVTNTVNGCSSSASSQVDTGANPPSASVIVTSTNNAISCQNSSVTLSATVTPAGSYSYTWSPSGGNSSSVVVSTAGNYVVTVLNSITGCSTTAALPITGNTVAPSASVSNATIPCGSPSLTIGPAASSATNVAYSWSALSGGVIVSGSSTSSPVVGSAGQYVVTITNNDNGCTNTATATVTQNTITAVFSANPTSGTAPLNVNFTNQSTGASSYSWNFGDVTSVDNTSSSSDPNHIFNTTGNYTVVLTASNGSCIATATLSIEVLENSSIIVPNVFTPNGDGKNDKFMILTTGMKDLTCDIFNRWGQKLYSIKSVNDSWDGGNAPDGTYFYMLNCMGYDGKEYKQQGYINLFR